jgi:DNA-binding beta-propeller fold protein YncE
MNSRLRALSFLIILVTTGCASQWVLRTEKPDISMQWPYQPNPAKVTYVTAIKGFELKGGSGSLVRIIVYGKDGSSQNSFTAPVAIATGKDGRIAVADTGCRCVHLYIPAEQRYLRLSKTDQEEVVSPVSVIFDNDLKLYVSDSIVGKVFVFGSDGTFLFSLPKDGSEALKRPTGLAYNSREKLLYVVDTLGNKILAFNEHGDIAFSFGQRGEAGGNFNFPTHIFKAPSGALFITDSLNFRIEFFDEKGGYLGSFGHHGDGSGDLAMPKGVAVDKDGVIYVVDSLFDNVQLFGRKGQFLLTVGKRGSDFGEFWLPSGIFIDDSGKLYICDTYNQRIQVFQITENYAGEKF